VALARFPIFESHAALPVRGEILQNSTAQNAAAARLTSSLLCLGVECCVLLRSPNWGRW